MLHSLETLTIVVIAGAGIGMPVIGWAESARETGPVIAGEASLTGRIAFIVPATRNGER